MLRALAARPPRALLFIALAANLVPATLLFWFIGRYGVDVPQWDEWLSLPTLEGFAEGRLTLTTLLAQHNEHRPLFPRLITLTNAMLFHWDRRVEMACTAFLLIACAVFFYLFARRYWNHPLTPVFILPVTWTILGWRQWENLLWGFQTCFGLFVAGVVVSFVSLHRARGAGAPVATASIAAFVATFSLAGGLFLWPVGVAQLAIQRARRGVFAVWIGAGVLTSVVFFYRYRLVQAKWPTGVLYVLTNPVAAVRYLATLIGSPFTDRQPIAELGGYAVAALAVCALILLWRVRGEQLLPAAPLLSLLAFTAVALLANCDRRLAKGIEQATLSRYTTAALLGLIALYLLLVRLALTDRRRIVRLAPAALGLLMFLGTAVSIWPWRHDPPGRYEDFAIRLYGTRYADLVSSRILAYLSPRSKLVPVEASFLRAHGYTLFHDAPPPEPPARSAGTSSACNVSLNQDDDAIEVAGWARDADRVWLSIDGHLDLPTRPVEARPDGFAASLRGSLLAPGDHTLELKLVDKEEKTYRTCGRLKFATSR